MMFVFLVHICQCDRVHPSHGISEHAGGAHAAQVERIADAEGDAAAQCVPGAAHHDARAAIWYCSMDCTVCTHSVSVFPSMHARCMLMLLVSSWAETLSCLSLDAIAASRAFRDSGLIYLLWLFHAPTLPPSAWSPDARAPAPLLPSPSPAPAPASSSSSSSTDDSAAAVPAAASWSAQLVSDQPWDISWSALRVHEPTAVSCESSSSSSASTLSVADPIEILPTSLSSSAASAVSSSASSSTSSSSSVGGKSSSFFPEVPILVLDLIRHELARHSHLLKKMTRYVIRSLTTVCSFCCLFHHLCLRV